MLEELFGEIRDEFDLEGPELTKVGDGEWLVVGQRSISSGCAMSSATDFEVRGGARDAQQPDSAHAAHASRAPANQ